MPYQSPYITEPMVIQGNGRYVCNGSQRKRRMSAIQAAKAAKAAKKTKHFKVKKMTSLPKYDIDTSLITEILFSNEEAFNTIDTQTAMMIRCVCKNATLNNALQRKRDVYKADDLYNKLSDMIGSFIMSKREYLSCSRYDTRGKDTPVISSSLLETLSKRTSRLGMVLENLLLHGIKVQKPSIRKPVYIKQGIAIIASSIEVRLNCLNTMTITRTVRNSKEQ